MQIKKVFEKPTLVKLQIVPSAEELSAIHDIVLSTMSQDNLKVPGFRPGKIPPALVEKYVDNNKLQTEFLDYAINQLYGRAIESEKLRPVEQPSINITKFVPFATLEFDAEVEIVGEVKLPDYKKIKLEKQAIKVTAKEVVAILDSLQTRAAERKESKQSAKKGDEVVIDFVGADAKTGKPVNGADGKGYPLVLGSNNFIPGFEDELIGLKSGDKKSFTITFPSDYAASALRNKKVTFDVTVKKVETLSAAPIDDAFAEQVSPFKTLKELKEDIKKQLGIEAQSKIDRAFENEIITKIAEMSEVAVPEKLVEQQLERAELEEKQNLAYRGQTWQEHLDEEGVTQEEHRQRNRATAMQGVKASLVLSEIAEREQIHITPEEFEVRIQILKGQYQDKQMQTELDKPEQRQTVANQILTEKTFERITKYAQQAA